MTEPCAKTIKAPNNNMTSIIGASQNFLRIFKNSQRSHINSIMIKKASQIQQG